MDIGRIGWERELVARLRLGQYQWRTEMTYRDGAWRFAHWLEQRTLESATDADIKGFLTCLALSPTLPSPWRARLRRAASEPSALPPAVAIDAVQ